VPLLTCCMSTEAQSGDFWEPSVMPARKPPKRIACCARGALQLRRDLLSCRAGSNSKGAPRRLATGSSASTHRPGTRPPAASRGQCEHGLDAALFALARTRSSGPGNVEGSRPVVESSPQSQGAHALVALGVGAGSCSGPRARRPAGSGTSERLLKIEAVENC
jgi:hypothetical protein